MAFYKQDIVDVNLETGVIHRSFLNHTIGHKDDDADRFGIRAFRNGEPVDLSGAQCQAVFMAPDGTNIALTSYGTVSGNEAYVTLPQACYNVEGQFCLAIKLVGSDVTATVRIIDGVVDRTGATGAVAPTEAVPTYQEILAVYAEMQEDVADYESVVATQNGKIDDLKSALTNGKDPLNYFDAVNDNPASVHGTAFTFSFVAGKAYRLYNAGSVTVSLLTRNGTTNVETISVSLAAGQTIDFVPTQNASALFVYWAQSGNGRILVYYGDTFDGYKKTLVLETNVSALESKVNGNLDIQLTHGRKYLRGNPNGTVAYHTSGGNRVCTGNEKINVLDMFDECIDTVESINYDGAVSIGNITIQKTSVSVQLLFYDSKENTYTISDLNNNHKPTTVLSITGLQNQNYEFYTGILYGNSAIRIKFNPYISKIADNLPSGEYYYYDCTSASFGCGIDGFVPVNVTNPLYNNAYPPVSVFRDHNWLFSLNDAIKEIVFLQNGFIGSPVQLAISNNDLIISIAACKDNSSHYISNSDETYTVYSLEVALDDLEDVCTVSLDRYGTPGVIVTIEKTKIASGIDLGTSTGGANTTAVIVPEENYTQVQAYQLFAGYYNASGGFVSDNDYMTYFVPINKDCRNAIISGQNLANTKIALGTESGCIRTFVTPTGIATKVNVEGYSYIAYCTSRTQANVSFNISGYKADEALMSVVALRKSNIVGHENIGGYDITRLKDGSLLTDDERSIKSYPTGNYPFFEVEEYTGTFTNPADNKTYSEHNSLMEICRDGTKYWLGLRADNDSSDYFFPIIWKEKDGNKSLVLGTNEDQPSDAEILQGSAYPDLSGIYWLERSNNTLYQQMDSITELSNGELLICLMGYVPDGDNSVFSSVVFVTIDNRTKWVPKFICTNQKYTYNGSNYSVQGYPTKNNSIQVFQTKYDNTRDCILISEYGSGTPLYWREKGEEKNGNGVVGKVWMSIDGGQTFKKIFDLDEKINGDADDLSDDNWKWCKSYKGRMASHLHCAYYDPINEMVWITNGDAGTEDGRNTLYYMHMQDLFGWVNAQGTAVSPTTLHPTYTDNEVLPPFMQYVMTEQGRDVSYVANLLSTQVNFQMYSMIATEKMIVLGNDTSRKIIFGIHNTAINHDSYGESTNLFIDIVHEIDESNPSTTLNGMPETFFRRDENSPVLCFYSANGIYGSWDGVNWRRLFVVTNSSKQIGFTTHCCLDTDGRVVFTYKGEGTPDVHNWKIKNY